MNSLGKRKERQRNLRIVVVFKLVTTRSGYFCKAIKRDDLSTYVSCQLMDAVAVP